MLTGIEWDARGAVLAWAYFGLLLPALLFVSAAVHNWRTLGRREVFRWQSHWRFLVVIVVLVEILTYQWLFANKFYRIEATRDAWRLGYLFPNRTTSLDPAGVRQMDFEPVRFQNGRVEILMRDGQRYHSAQASAEEQQARIDQLRMLLQSSNQERDSSAARATP